MLRISPNSNEEVHLAHLEKTLEADQDITLDTYLFVLGSTTLAAQGIVDLYILHLFRRGGSGHSGG